jgi:hypothetical protein
MSRSISVRIAMIAAGGWVVKAGDDASFALAI